MNYNGRDVSRVNGLVLLLCENGQVSIAYEHVWTQRYMKHDILYNELYYKFNMLFALLQFVSVVNC